MSSLKLNEMLTSQIKNGDDTEKNFTQFPDGTLLCWGRVSIASGSTNTWVTFPMTFINNNVRVITSPVRVGAGTGNVITSPSGVASTGFSAYSVTTSDGTPTTSRFVSWIALGRWK